VTRQAEHLFLEESELIGAKLCRSALWSGGRCYWEDDFLEVVENKRSVVRRPVAPDVYFGASGIALFLAALYSLAPEKQFRSAAEGSARLTLTQIDELDPRFPVGFYIGHLGIAFALMRLGEAFADENLITGALRVVRRVGERDDAAQGLDVLSGVAGAIPALLTLHEKYPDGPSLDLAVSYGERLVRHASEGDGDSLPAGAEDARPGARPHTGFSHGDAGVAWALLELASATGEERFSAAAGKIFRAQRTWFELLRRRLRDREETPAQDRRHSFSWCNGAVGLAVSRLRAYELTREQIYRDEAETALTTTLEALRRPGGGSDYSICHGIAGAGDAFMYAAEVLNEVGYRDAAVEKGLEGIEQVRRKGLPWPCGSVWGGETLNLMQGVAGIGYFYLRLHDPVKTPPLAIILPDRGRRLTPRRPRPRPVN
jgi:lantibiotic modifying enzyme